MNYALSPAGLALIQEHEGFRAEPAPLSDGLWVVGHGHVRAGQPGKRVTRKRAAELLAKDLAPAERVVNERVKAPLTQAQYDALVSFAFSIGVDAFVKSQVLRRVNAGEFVAAACAMDAWRKSEVSGRLEIAGALVRRRAAEKALLLQDLPPEPAPSAVLRAKLDAGAPILGASPKRAAPARKAAAQSAQAASDPGKRITDILRSEPATAALLLTAVVPADPVEEEIVTAHAKPVARRTDMTEHAPAPFARMLEAVSTESFGLMSLLVVGLALVSVSAGLMFNGGGDLTELAAAAVLATPGAAAAIVGAVALSRPREESLRA